MSDAIQNEPVDPADPQLASVSAVVQTAQILYRGEVPDNKQIIATIDGTLDAMEERAREAVLNQRGQLLATDAQRILENSKKFIEQKNPDEKIQQLFYHSKAATKETSKQAKKIKETTGIDQMQGQAEDVFYITKRVIMEIAKSKEFRNLLTDTVGLLQSMFWKQLDSRGTVINEDVKTRQQTTTQGRLPEYTRRDYQVPEGQRVVFNTNGAPPASSGLSEEEKNKLLDKVGTILNKLSANPEYHKAINGIFMLIDQLQIKAALLNDSENTSKFKLTPTQVTVKEDLISLLERWTGEGSLKPVLDNVSKFYGLIMRDPRAVHFFADGKKSLGEAFRFPEKFNTPESRQHFSVLIDQLRSLMSDPRYSSYWKDILEQISDILRSFKEDEVSQALGDAVRCFVADITLDRNGRVSLGAIQDSIVQMKSLFLPVLLKQLEAIPIGKIQGSNPKMDYEVDHVIFSAYDVLPEMIRINFLTLVNVDMKELATDNAKARLRLEINNIRSHLRDIHFKFQRKVFPKMEDEGSADLDIFGAGLSMSIEWEISSEDRKGNNEPMLFRVKQVLVKVDQISVSIKAAKHPTLDRIGMKLLSGKVKRQLEDEIETYLNYFGRYIADGLNSAIRSKHETEKPKSLVTAQYEGTASADPAAVVDEGPHVIRPIATSTTSAPVHTVTN